MMADSRNINTISTRGLRLVFKVASCGEGMMDIWHTQREQSIIHFRKVEPSTCY